MDLRWYEAAKFQLASIVRSFYAFSNRDSKLDDELRDLFVRLAEDRFNLAIVGRFGRGKTSLMNALIGSDILPTGILPLTSAITSVFYGSMEKVIVRFEGSDAATEIQIEDIPKYVTQSENPGNVRRVKTVEIQIPAEILRRGIYFCDTPGLGSAISENTQTTETFLPEADALLIVTSYDSPLSVEELALLRLAARYNRKVFVVLNKQDVVTESQREEGLNYVNGRIQETLGVLSQSAFSVSARDGIDAKSRGDRETLRASGIAPLEAELIHFLLDKKRGAFLSSFCERLIDIAQRYSDAPEYAGAISSLQAFRREFVIDSVADEPFDPVSDTPNVVGSRSLQSLDPCEICQHLQVVSFEFLRHYQYDLTISSTTQKEHANLRGFCAMHTRQLASLAAPRGVAIGFPTLLESLSAALSNIVNSAMAKSASRADLCLTTSEDECVVCRLCFDALVRSASEIAKRVQEGPPSSVETMSAICLMHLPYLVAAIDNPIVANEVLMREAAILARLAEDLRRYATKHDAIRRQLATREEVEAVERSVSILSGLANVPVPGRSALLAR